MILFYWSHVVASQLYMKCEVAYQKRFMRFLKWSVIFYLILYPAPPQKRLTKTWDQLLDIHIVEDVIDQQKYKFPVIPNTIYWFCDNEHFDAPLLASIWCQNFYVLITPNHFGASIYGSYQHKKICISSEQLWIFDQLRTT